MSKFYYGMAVFMSFASFVGFVMGNITTVTYFGLMTIVMLMLSKEAK